MDDEDDFFALVVVTVKEEEEEEEEGINLERLVSVMLWARRLTTSPVVRDGEALAVGLLTLAFRLAMVSLRF